MFLFLLLTETLCHIRFPLIKNLIVYDPLHDIHQVEYLTKLQFGSSKEVLELIIDTGSSDLWVPDSQSQDFENTIKKYDCTQSTTCIKTNEKLGITYDDGPIQGVITWDLVWLKEIQFNQSFLLINEAGQSMASAGGILGLGFRALAVNPNPSILDSLYQQNLISERMFSLYLKDTSSEGSFLIFGGIDGKYIQEGQNLIYTPITSDYAYQISIQGVQVAGRIFSSDAAIVDSGTSCLTFPSALLDSMLVEIQQNGLECSYRVESYAPAYCMINCIVNGIEEETILEQFPEIGILIENTLFKFKAEEYIYSCHQISETQSKCLTKLERSEQDDLILLGDAFLQSYYTVFDQGNMRLGFAHSINNRKLTIKQLNSQSELISATATVKVQTSTSQFQQLIIVFCVFLIMML